MAVFQFEHHPFNMLVVLVRPKEMQAFLWITPLQDLDRLLTGAPRIHCALIRHVKVYGIAPGKCPSVILHAIYLPGREQTEDRACRPTRPVSRRASGNQS